MTSEAPPGYGRVSSLAPDADTVPVAMSENRTSPSHPGPGDGWTIIAYLLSGLVVWGGAGWLVDQWLGTRFGILAGLLIGMGSALYLVYIRYVRQGP
jgi:F0F1-type ATP synthase assembly protein I